MSLLKSSISGLALLVALAPLPANNSEFFESMST